VQSGEPPRIVRTEPSFAGPLVLGERSRDEC
jgi:hypothetical protein